MNISDLKGLSLLFVSEDALFLNEIGEGLENFGASVFTSNSIDEAEKIVSFNLINTVIVDLNLADGKCFDFIDFYKSGHPEGLFYLVIEHDYGSIETNLDLEKIGVEDYLKKPLDPVKFAQMIKMKFPDPYSGSTALAVMDPLVTKIRPYFQFRSPAMRIALDNLPKIAASNEAVLITGETGTGKEIISRAIHVLSPRANGPFVALNCGAIPEGLIEGELFGHEKGAFTGAHKMRKGKFETADGGTLLLDEIGDMPLNLQVRLLRVLEEGVLYRVGGEDPVPVNVRVISATRRDLYRSVKEGLFRDDLYYRLNILRLKLPPLRERTEDISFLARHFLERAFSELGMPHPYPRLSPATIDLIESLAWKGNVRELRNVITRVATFLPDRVNQVLPIHIIPHLEDREKIDPGNNGGNNTNGLFIPIGTPMARVHDMLIDATLEYTGGNRTKAAKLLGIGLRTLRRKVNKETN